MRWALELGRTPRELLASVTSSDITEMMAFERLEPFGALATEMRIGAVAAAVCNSQRTRDDSPIWSARDFMPALDRALKAAEPPPPELDPEALSAQIDRMMFGRV